MKVALVTGGSRGLGKNAVKALIQKNIGVIFTYNANLEEAEKTLKEIGGKGHFLKLDTSDVRSFDAFYSDLQALLLENFQRPDFDFLLNNAGIGKYSSIINTKEEDFDDLMNIHFRGVFFLTQKLLPLIKDGGRILNVSSGLTRFSYPGYATYAAMKGAIEVFTKYLALELGDRKIAVNCIAPGAIETDFGGGQVKNNKVLNQKIADQTPLGRVGQPEDIGPMMAELLSGNLGWVNGQRIEASGGIHG